MKSILCTSCFLDGLDNLGNDRLERNIRYIEYYYKIRDELDLDKIKLIDNGSSQESIDKLMAHPASKLVEFESLPHLAHKNKEISFHYPHCWRSLYLTADFIKQGYEKILMIDSDAFIVSRKLAIYVKDLKSGWTSFWCPRWQMPDSAISILCEDAFPVFFDFIKIPFEQRIGMIMENTIPYTHIEKKFNCDRFGEYGDVPHDYRQDMYGQLSLRVPVEFGKFK